MAAPRMGARRQGSRMGAIGGIGLGILGAIAGGQRQNQTQDTTRILGAAPANEQQGADAASSGLKGFGDLMGYGPGQQDMQASTDSSRSLASMLAGYSQNGFMPSQQDYGYAQQMTNSIFQPQQVAMQQAFGDQNIQANRNAALMGRGPNDPVLQNMLMKEQTRQQQGLQGQMTSYMSQQAQQLPQQRLQYAQQLAQVNSGLASQALANRQALFSMGSSLQKQGEDFQTGASSTQTSQGSGGGLMGGLTGALGMFKAGAGIASAFGGMSSMFSGGGGATSTGGGMSAAQSQAGSTA